MLIESVMLLIESFERQFGGCANHERTNFSMEIRGKRKQRK
jgi:hypothetical protein